MNIFTHRKQKSIHSLIVSFLILSFLLFVLSACNMTVVIPTPSTGSIVESTPSQNNLATQALLSPSPMDIATEIPTLVKDLAVENFPSELNFIDGRNVKEMVSSLGKDEITGLECAFDDKETVVAYNLRNNGKDLWVVNPLIEKGFKWNFDTNENGQYILHNALEENNYKPFPIEGIKYVKPDELPVTFWDESNPVREDEKYPWPSEGSLAVFDGEGDVLMYYSKHENAWWFAGYQVELPGNMVFRQSSMSLALSGVRYKQVDEEVWPGPDLNDNWQEIRNHVDWVAYTNRTGNFISFENFSSRVAKGEVFKYQSWVFDLATSEYKLTTLSNKTKMYFETTISKRDFGNSYDSVFDAKLLSVALEYRSGILLNPDDSISIINERTDATVSHIQLKNLIFLAQGIYPFNSYTINFLAASDKYQKEGVVSGPEGHKFYMTTPPEVILRQTDRLSILHLSDPMRLEVEYQLNQGTPIIYPQVENPHPYQKP